MKSRTILRRALAGLLSLAAVLALSVWPAPTSVLADETEFDTSNTAFTEPQWDTGMMYFWHEGLPQTDAAFDENGNVLKYPLLITWDDQYYFCFDENFQNLTLQSKDKCKDNYGWYWLGTDCDRLIPYFTYYQYYSYPMTAYALLSKSGFDAETLLTLGEAVSMQTPKVPYIVTTDPSNDRYALAAPEEVSGKNTWLVGSLFSKLWVEESFGHDDHHEGEAWPFLYIEKWAPEEFLNPQYVYSGWKSIYDVNKHKDYQYIENAENHYWTIRKDPSGRYHFWTTGESATRFARISGVSTSDTTSRIRRWFHASDLARVFLTTNGSSLRVQSQTPLYKNWLDRVQTVDNTGNGFRVFYADPNIVSFYKNSFTVEDGQVVSLEGPLVIDPKCTVTVKQGGVLSCSGWIINDGQILVEPGGMLIVQERQTDTGDKQYGAITSLETAVGDGAGRIACDGIMIVNPDCKVVGSGCYGLQFGEGAQVVNYGQIMAENLDVYTDHTIENRGDSSAVFAGWSVVNSGYALTRSRIAGDSYLGKGTRENLASVKMPKDAVYGPGADRVYVNGGSSIVRDVGIANRKGFVSGFVATVRTQLWEPPELPPNIPIYMDSRYDTAFIMVRGSDDVTRIYHYDSTVGRYVLISEDGSGQTFFDYTAPSKVEEYLDGQLPDGYRLSDGRVVGEPEPPENLRYDHTAAVWWFTAQDGHAYYWEDALEAYISVDNARKYHVLTEEAVRPIQYSTLAIPSTLYEDLPAGTILYEEGMEQSTGEFFEYDYDPSGKPKVQKDEDGNYYVIWDGRYGIQRYGWSSSNKLFIYGGSAYGWLDSIDPSQVDLNGYKLP